MNSYLRIYNHSAIPKTSDCGKPNPGIWTVNGTQVTVGHSPWHVAIYKLSSNSSFTLICGGTIASPVMIISGKNPKKLSKQKGCGITYNMCICTCVSFSGSIRQNCESEKFCVLRKIWTSPFESNGQKKQKKFVPVGNTESISYSFC